MHLVAVDDPPVGQHHPRRQQLVTRQPVSAAQDAQPAAQGQPSDADGATATCGQASPYPCSASPSGPSRVPAPTVAVPSDTETAFIGLTSIRMPSVEDRPAKQCPPLRATTGRPRCRAYPIAAATSPLDPQRTTPAG